MTEAYASPARLEKFRRENREMALAGRDLVAQLEAPVTQQRAAAIVGRHDQTIARVAHGDGSPDARVRALSQLTSDGVRLLEQELGSTGPTPARAQARVTGLRLLEQNDEPEGPYAAAHRRVLERMQATGEHGAEAYLRLLEQESRI